MPMECPVGPSCPTRVQRILKLRTGGTASVTSPVGRVDSARVVEYTWVFQREGQKVLGQHWRRPDKVWELSLIWPSGEIETEDYVDVSALVDQHERVARALTQSGWSAVESRRRGANKGAAVCPAHDRR
jgi:hypothetical protein